MKFKIEEGIKMPGVRQGREPRFPWREMKVGQSFFVPSKEAKHNVVRACACAFARRHDVKFTVAKNGDGVRVWRLK